MINLRTPKMIFGYLIIILTVLAIPHKVSAAAELLLYPTRIILDDSDNIATIGLKNSGNATGNYRVDLVDMDMKEQGSSVIMDKDAVIPYSAIKMLRISPRSVTLEPNSNQNIRLMVRKPKNLEDGEYRSHLRITMVNDNVGENLPVPKEHAMGIQVKARLATIIPIIIRHGKTFYDIKITAAKIRYETSENGQKTPFIDINFLRTGNRSSMGDIDVTYTNPSGKQYVIKHIAGVAIYRSTERRKVSLAPDIPAGVALTTGTLHITYHAQESEDRKLLAEGDFPL